jgi:hypothetical protein
MRTPDEAVLLTVGSCPGSGEAHTAAVTGRKPTFGWTSSTATERWDRLGLYRRPDVRLCRIEGIAQAHTYAQFDMFHRGLTGQIMRRARHHVQLGLVR